MDENEATAVKRNPWMRRLKRLSDVVLHVVSNYLPGVAAMVMLVVVLVVPRRHQSQQ